MPAILHHSDDPRAAAARAALLRLLGRPNLQEGEHSAWVLAERAGPIVEGCRRPRGTWLLGTPRQPDAG